MQRNGALYTILFALGTCVVCAAMVTTAAYALKDRQASNRLLDRQKKILAVAGLIESEQAATAQQVSTLFAERIDSEYIELGTGKSVPESEVMPFAAYNAKQAANDPNFGMRAPANNANIMRVPKYALVYRVKDESGAISKVVLPIEGYGLWGTLFGYLAVENDGQTIAGITYYEHKETPGLGGEVDNPRWKESWVNRKIYEDGAVEIAVRKGGAGSPEEDPYHADGISGATITGNGVTNMLQFWLGEEAFKPYLESLSKA